jgi:hypothetical protein
MPSAHNPRPRHKVRPRAHARKKLTGDEIDILASDEGSRELREHPDRAVTLEEAKRILGIA